MTKFRTVGGMIMLFAWIICLPVWAKAQGNQEQNSNQYRRKEMEEEVSKEEKFYLPFCHNATFSGNDLEEYITITSSIQDVIQGMCVAEGYIIATRWHDNNSTTEFKIYHPDATVQRTFVYKAGHANSLAYNPDKHELLVAACDDTGRVFTFSFYNGNLTYKGAYTLPYNITKVCYVSSIKKYYLCTGVRMFSTSNFKDINLEFEINAFATGQGMTSDGKHIYVCWTPSGKNVIKAYSLSGEFLKEYDIPGEICRELEEIDFMDGAMLVADNRADADKIYKVNPTHHWTGWIIDAEATCIQKGKESRSCSSCGCTEEKIIQPNNNHEPAPAIEEGVSCTSSGSKKVYCKLCQKLIEEEELPALGHDYTNWTYTKVPDLSHSGEKYRSCRRCDFSESRYVARLEPICQAKEKSLSLKANTGDVLEIQIANGDQIQKICVSNPLLIDVKKDMAYVVDERESDFKEDSEEDPTRTKIVLPLHVWMRGSVDILIETRAGARLKLPVFIHY